MTDPITGEPTASESIAREPQTREPQTPEPPAREPLTLERLRDEVAGILAVPAEEIDPDDNLVDHGLDSIRLMRLAQQWQARGLGVGFPALAERPQLSHWWSLIAAAPGDHVRE